MPVAALRAKIDEIARGSARWDGQVVNLQATDFKERTMGIRILVGARTAPKTFDPRCEVREKMIAYLQREYPRSLLRIRSETPPGSSPAAARAFIDA